MTPLSVPVLETERLRLRGWMADDVPAIASLYANEETARHIGGVQRAENAWRMVACFIGHWQMNGFGLWCVERRDNRAVVGWTGLWFPAGWPEPELGYAFLAAHHGNGFAVEAATMALSHAYRVLGWKSAISLIHKDNAASQNVARKLHAIREKRDVQVLDHVCDIWRHQPAAAYLSRIGEG